jgi:hypothetical protein
MSIWFHNKWRIPLTAKRLPTSQEVLCPTELDMSTVILGKLLVNVFVKKSPPPFMEQKDSRQCTQDLATETYRSNPNHNFTFYFLKIHCAASKKTIVFTLVAVVRI